MKYVLIVMSYISNGGGTTAMHDFDSKAACEAAVQAIREARPGRVWSPVCVPKDAREP